MKLNTKRFTKSPYIQSDLETLKDPKIPEVFHAKGGGKLAEHCIFESDVDTLANSLKEGLLSTSKRSL